VYSRRNIVSASRNKVAGAIEYIRGKLQQAVGRQTGDQSAQAKGLGHRAKGGARYKTGEGQGKIKDKTKNKK
jgi:uncharacterized protein YjbJ (UPF0337 family)